MLVFLSGTTFTHFDRAAMKLVLINPVRERTGLSGNLRSRYPPLSLAVLAALTPEDWEVIVLDENCLTIGSVPDADLVGITAFTSNAPRAYEFATQCNWRGIPVVMGGVHVWARQNEALTYADAIVVQEAESVWREVCLDAAAHKLKKIYQGSPVREFAIPRRDVLDPGYHVASIATSRGCPEQCDFCSVHAFSGRDYRRQSLELVECDLRAVDNRDLFIVDDNFVGPGRKHREQALAILRNMEALDKRFVMQATMSICEDDELLAAARKAGCRLIFIGVEAGDKEGLSLIHKRQNLKHGFNFDRVHAAGLGVLGAFMIGLDSDTPAKLRERAKFIQECGVDAIQLTIVTPLPGTAMFDRLLQKNRLLYANFPADWARYDLTELTYLPRGFRSESEFYDAGTEVVGTIYGNAALKMMAQRTLNVTGCRETASYAYYCNLTYQEATLAKADLWGKDTRARAQQE